MTLALHGKSKTRQGWLIAIAVAMGAFAALAGSGALLGGGDARATGTVVVTGNTATYFNEPGKWLFNADPANATPYEFTTAAASISAGSLYVKPIGATPAAKFIGAFFMVSPLANVQSISYDFKIGSGGSAADANRFYMNVYANFAGSSPTKFYDCRYDVVASVGSTGAFTTVMFDPTLSYPVATRAGAFPSPFACPATPADMNAVGGPGATLRSFALNVGDTGALDAGLDGYLDNVVVALTGDTTVYDFELILGACSVTTDVPNTTITLLADCTTDHTLLVPNLWTLDGNGYTITAVDPAGGHFLGAVIKNAGASANVKNLTVTASGLANVCDEGANRLRGILFEGAAGSITNNTVVNVNQGPSGCQEGNAIEARNAPFDTTGSDLAVTISGNTVSGYIKNGITANGSVAATITNNVVTGSGPVGVPLAAQNGIQVGFGATAIVSGNTVSGNDYTPTSYDACGILFYQADGVKQSKNTLFNNERDMCNFGKGGGQFNPNP